MTNAPAGIAAFVDKLVTANHILYDHGVVDAFGHISARHPERENRFLLSRNKAPGSVVADDILEFGMDGELVQDSGDRVYLERFLHSEIYRARPDVQSIVHSHSHNIVPFTVLRTVRLRPICHMAGFIGDRAPVFEIREQFGESTDLLIRDGKRGKVLADCLGGSDIVLMRGHGSTVVADSVEKAVFRAVYAELNAKLQYTASSLDDVIFLTPEEASECTRVNESQVKRPWDLWAERARTIRNGG